MLLLLLIVVLGNEKRKVLLFIVIAIQIAIGCAYIYQFSQKDPRIAATAWIQKNIPTNARITTEAANVYDLPLNNTKGFKIASYFLYDEGMIASPEAYIIVPSRRVWANYTCLNRPTFFTIGLPCSDRSKTVQTNYYEQLFNKCALLHTETRLLPFEEYAEETWTVFERPVVRIYKCEKNSRM